MFQHRVFQLWIYNVSANNLSFQLHNLFRRSLLSAEHSCGRLSSNKGFRWGKTIRKFKGVPRRPIADNMSNHFTPVFLWLPIKDSVSNMGNFKSVYLTRRSWWPLGLRRGSAAARLLEMRVRISTRHKYLSLVNGLCDLPITCIEEPYRGWFVSVWLWGLIQHNGAFETHTRTHAHTHIYVYMCMCVCVCTMCLYFFFNLVQQA
jgi:hypothetical protein